MKNQDNSRNNLVPNDFLYGVEQDEWIERSSADKFIIRCYSGNDILGLPGASFLLPSRLLNNEITVLYGPYKSGKTFIAVLMSLMCAIGGEFWGSKFPEGGSDVVYFAAERPQQIVDRVEAACIFLGLSEIPKKFNLCIPDKPLKLSSEENLNALCKKVWLIQPRLVAFDTYARMNDKDEDKQKDADFNYDQLMKVIACSNVDTSGLLVHHSGKEASRGMRGSTALSAAVGAIWSVSKGADGGIELNMEECNAVENPEPAYFSIETVTCKPNPLTGEIRKVGVACPVASPIGPKNRGERILQILQDDPRIELKVEEIKQLLDLQGDTVAKNTISKYLADLVNAGHAEVIGGSKNTRHRAVKADSGADSSDLNRFDIQTE